MTADGPEIPPTDVATLILIEKAKTFLVNQLVTLLAGMFIAVSAAIITLPLLRNEDRVWIYCWLAFTLVLSVLRNLAGRYFRASRTHETNPRRVLLVASLFALASGLGWSVYIVLAYREHILFLPSIAFIIPGISAGAAIQSTTFAAPVLAFVLPLLSTFITALLTESSTEYRILAINSLFFTFMLCRGALMSERKATDSSRLAIEADQMSNSLRDANATAMQAMGRLEFIARHDYLSGLANRKAFSEMLEDMLGQAASSGEEVAILLIDLDHFKAINDTFGHATGDVVLSEASRRLKMVAVSSEQIARLGGDEFAVILRAPKLGNRAERLAGEIVEALASPVSYQGQRLTIGASVGVASFPRDGRNQQELMINADLALYAIKSDGRGGFRLFDAVLRQMSQQRRDIETDLHAALHRGEIALWFQPQVDLVNHRLTGLEALLRWNHPVHGWIAPPEIVSAAARNRLSRALTQHVLSTACRMIRRLDEAGFSEVTVAFNVSPDEIGHYPLCDLVRQEIELLGIPVHRLEVEMTEEAVLSDKRAIGELDALSRLGVRLAIDDFGVGYSSFGAMKKLHFNRLKIDRTFISEADVCSRSRALTKAMIGVAQALGVEVLAEGVETAAQAATLLSLGCRQIQGYYIARPMPAEEMIAWAEQQARISMAERVLEAETMADLEGGLLLR